MYNLLKSFKSSIMIDPKICSVSILLWNFFLSIWSHSSTTVKILKLQLWDQSLNMNYTNISIRHDLTFKVLFNFSFQFFFYTSVKIPQIKPWHQSFIMDFELSFHSLSKYFVTLTRNTYQTLCKYVTVKSFETVISKLN